MSNIQEAFGHVNAARHAGEELSQYLQQGKEAIESVVEIMNQVGILPDGLALSNEKAGEVIGLLEPLQMALEELVTLVASIEQG